MKDVLLGYEVGTGTPISIPIRNMVVSGQTQESGKTTTLEALIHRSKVRALAFVTKRGESSFAVVDGTPPYFRDRADWEFVQAILEATMRERMKFERAWIVRASKGASSLRDVQRNVRKSMETAKGMNADMYMLLDTYLTKVVPEIERHAFARTLALHPGLNVMDLSTFSTEMQMLIIPSCLEWIYQREKDVVCVIPEAWEFLPTNRKSPVSMTAVELIRKGSVLRNYLWLDSQDLAGVSTEIRRNVIVWLLGVQREANEVKRGLEHIPASVKKPSVADIMQLERGQFFACFGKHVVKVYVQPAWMTENLARQVATGQIPIETANELSVIARTTRAVRQAFDSVFHPAAPDGTVWTDDKFNAAEFGIAKVCVACAQGQHVQCLGGRCQCIHEQEEPTVKESEATKLRQENAELRRQNAELLRRIDALDVGVQQAIDRPRSTPPDIPSRQPRAFSAEESFDNEQMYQAIKTRLIAEAPALVKLLTEVPELEVTVTRKTLTYDEYSLKGRLAKLLKDGFFREPKKPGNVRTQLQRTGPDANTANIGRALDDFTKDGFLTNESAGYVEVADMKVRVVAA